MHRERWQANYQAVIQTAIIAALVILIPSWSVAADTSKDPEINNQNFMITTVTELPDWEPRIDETFTLNQVVTYRDGEENIDEK